MNHLQPSKEEGGIEFARVLEIDNLKQKQGECFQAVRNNVERVHTRGPAIQTW